MLKKYAMIIDNVGTFSRSNHEFEEMLFQLFNKCHFVSRPPATASGKGRVILTEDIYFVSKGT